MWVGALEARAFCSVFVIESPLVFGGTIAADGAD